MNKKIYDGYTYVDGGVCAAKGFTANGLNCGLNPDKNKNDLGMVFSEVPCVAAGVYTQNKVKGAPVTVTKEHLKKSGNKAQAVIVNSKNANTCNADGIEKAEKISQLAADALGIDVNLVINASTGVIGQIIPIEPFEEHMKELADGLTADGNDKAVNAIMTTDTVPKQYAVKFMLGDSECTVGGMAKGSGMIHPNMATMLTFITTDAAVAPDVLKRAVKKAADKSFNMVVVDGDTSTNDSMIVLANGLAENEIILSEEHPDYPAFFEALVACATDLAKMIAHDGEGATKFLEVNVTGAATWEDAKTAAMAIAKSPLVKTAFFGEDPNWGRIVCAAGYSGAAMEADKVNLSIGGIRLVENGMNCNVPAEKLAPTMAEHDISMSIDLGAGEESATVWTCDFSYEYVKINGEYHT